MPPPWCTKYTAQPPALANQFTDSFTTTNEEQEMHAADGPQFILAEEDVPFLDFSLLFQALVLVTPQPHHPNSPATWSLAYSACPASSRTAGKTETEKEF